MIGVVLLFLPLVTSQQLFDCYWNHSILTLAEKDAKLKIVHPKSIHLTWESVQSGNQLVINATNQVTISTNFSKVILIEAQTNCSTTCSAAAVKASTIIWLVPVLLALHKTMLFRGKTILRLLLLMLCASWTLSSMDCSRPSVHIKIPMKHVSKMCINNDRCFPIRCDLEISSSQSKAGYSNINSENTVLFSDRFCTIKKPQYWDEWVNYHFKVNGTTEVMYYLDYDNDGLVNILEYYAGFNFTDSSVRNHQRKKRDVSIDVKKIGSDPKNPDSDKDLLLDGFESSFGMSPLKPDSSNADDDNDLLSNIQEQIYETDPLNADSDGDGVNDGIEVQNNADPNNPTDEGTTKPSDIFAMIRLTIGDQSGSHSERYNLNVGSISHQAPDFGVIGHGTYKFEPGTYTIKVQWVASKYRIPDYDYTAHVLKVGGKNTNVTIEDPSDILGVFHDSYYDRTIGKKAKLIVKPNCSGNTKDIPACFATCKECQESAERKWDPKRKICREKSFFETQGECPCHKCYEWYKDEMKDIGWLNELNSNVGCPCRANDTGSYLKSANEGSIIKWKFDPACKRNGKSSWYFLGIYDCDDFHPEAYGCIRSTWRSHKQQCCYNANLTWIESGSRSSGTPDKAASFSDHQTFDVDPFKLCCKECTNEKYCNYYIRGVRMGPKTCSKTA